MVEQPEQRQETQGSKFAEMFGVVTPEDRTKWDQQRHAMQARSKQGSMKTYSKSSLGSMLEFGETNMKAKLSAAHRTLSQRELEEDHTRTVTRGRDGQLITEMVSYEDKDDRTMIGDDDPEMEMG